ncbi:MAG: hypothetical protein CMJ31_06515 [Phycisphaerae bacterium]|nr:hypothetical protein [Phycisphaerae bacterium]
MHGDIRSCTRSERGFSLLEMVVVLAIVGGVMGLVAPRVASAISGDSPREQTRSLRQWMAERRIEAIESRERSQIVLSFDVRDGLVAHSGDVERVWPRWKLPPVGDDGKPAKSVEVSFSGDGRSDRVSVTFGERDTVWQIDFDPVTGWPTMAAARGDER